jgi:hypothetical protein
MLNQFASRLRAPITIGPAIHYVACAIAIAGGLGTLRLVLSAFVFDIDPLSLFWRISSPVFFFGLLLWELMYRPPVRLMFGLGVLAMLPFLALFLYGVAWIIVHVL